MWLNKFNLLTTYVPYWSTLFILESSWINMNVVKTIKPGYTPYKNSNNDVHYIIVRYS